MGGSPPSTFSGYKQRPRPSFVLDIAGGEGKGKTHLALTSPKPAICDTERKAYRILDKGIGNPDKYFYPDTWEEIESFINHVVQDDEVDTVILDTIKEVEELAYVATLESLGKESLYSKEAGAVQYKYVNQKLEWIIRSVRRAGKGLVTTARVKDEYVSNNKTGRVVRDGWSKMPYYADFCVISVETLTGIPPSSLKPATYVWKVTKNGMVAKGLHAPFIVASSYGELITSLQMSIDSEGQETYLEELKARISK